MSRPTILASAALIAVIFLTMESPGARGASQPSAAATSAALDRMTASGKTDREKAQYVFDTHGCKNCHTAGEGGKLGMTEQGKELAHGFEGCIPMLTAMNVIAQVDPSQRSAGQKQKAARFQEFGCTFCHQITPGKMGLSVVGTKLKHMKLGCVEVESLVASQTGKKP